MMNTTNKIVANALAANAGVVANKPYDIPMGTDPSEKVIVKMDEFVPLYGQREARPYRTTLEKLPSHLQTWGLASHEAGIKRALKKGEKYRINLTVTLPFEFGA